MSLHHNLNIPKITLVKPDTLRACTCLVAPCRSVSLSGPSSLLIDLSCLSSSRSVEIGDTVDDDSDVLLVSGDLADSILVVLGDLGDWNMSMQTSGC